MVSERTDAGGFQSIAERHADYLRRRAQHLCGNRTTAQDLVQETLKRALEHFGEFQQGTDARAWLSTILTRLYLDQLKHHQVVNGAQVDIVALHPTEARLELTAMSDVQLWAAVDELEDDLRTPLELHYRDGLKYREIAERLNVPQGTIGRRLSNAYRRLKERLTP